MYGETVNTLAVYLQMLGTNNRIQLWYLQGNQGNMWLLQRIDVNLYNYNLTVKIFFKIIVTCSLAALFAF
jgi:hypothetical protein